MGDGRLLDFSFYLVLFIFSIPVPTLVTDAIGHMGELNTSLPMLIVGYYIAQTDILVPRGAAMMFPLCSK